MDSINETHQSRALLQRPPSWPRSSTSTSCKTFVAIADTGSFTRAADVVHKTQSAVSMQMKRLEERLGRPIFERDGRASKLTEDGERLLDYARRILRLNLECLASFADAELAGRVRLGVPDDYADRYLPEILARFSRSNPKVEVTVVCEPTPMLVDRIQTSDLDLAIITHVEGRGPAEVIRQERLLWVTSQRHGGARGSGAAAGARPADLQLAPGRDRAARSALGRPYRVLYSSWNSNAVGAAVLAGLAVAVLPESAVRPGMRVLGPSEGFPAAALLQDRAGAQPARGVAAGRRARGAHRIEPGQPEGVRASAMAGRSRRSRSAARCGRETIPPDTVVRRRLDGAIVIEPDAPITVTEKNAAMRPYSMAVAPLSQAAKRSHSAAAAWRRVTQQGSAIGHRTSGPKVRVSFCHRMNRRLRADATI